MVTGLLHPPRQKALTGLLSCYGACRIRRRRDNLSRNQVNPSAATVSPTTSEIQNPCAAIGSCRHGSQSGAKPSMQPSGNENPQKAAIWMTMGGRVTL